MTALELAGICAMALGIGLLGWRFRQPHAFAAFSRWRLWHRRLLAARRQGHAAAPPSVRAMRAALPRAGGRRKRSRQLVSHAHAFAAPRLLFLGDASAALPALLAAVAPAGPLQQALPGEEPFWRWWGLPRLVAIELCPPPPPQEPPRDLLWIHALRTLAWTQPDRPLDGIVLCISTAMLRADPKVAQPVVQLLARRIHQTAALLEPTHMPMHVLLTGLQDLPGYATVRAALPAPLLAQALGWCAPAGRSAQAWQDAMHSWQAALHGLRLSLMAQEHTALERHDIHRFVEAVLSLSRPLHQLQQNLGLDGEARLSLQGFYLTAAAPNAAFVEDLFDRFLPIGAAHVNESA